MTKENLEIYQEVFPKSQLRRMKVVDEYLNTFGEMIRKKVISRRTRQTLWSRPCRC